MPARRKLEEHDGYVNIFNDLGSDWEAIVDKRNTDKEARFIGGTVPKNGLTLDLCCGTARHSIFLRRRGYHVIGMDLSKNLLSMAHVRTKEAAVELPLVRAEMCHFPFREGVFDAVINMFTSFGYLPSEAEDMKSLSEINRTLKVHGKFLLDLANRKHIELNFQERDWGEFEPFYLLEKRSLDLKKSKLTSQWTLIRKKDRTIRSVLHEVRLYTLDKIRKMLIEAELTLEQVYGGYEKQTFNQDASRMILIAQKHPLELISSYDRT